METAPDEHGDSHEPARCPLPLFSAEVSLSLVERYSRQMIVDEIGVEGQKKLLSAKILVVGCGGLGSPALLYLAAMGVGYLGIADDDTVATSNLNRQVLFDEAAVGGDKVERAMARLRAINSAGVFKRHPKIGKDNVWAVCSEYDLVVDCADSRSLRYLLSDYASVRGIPFICGSSLRWEGAVYHFNKWCYRCIYPKLSARPLETCASAGIIGSLCGVVGSAIATEALKAVLGVTQETYLVFVNVLKNEWLRIPLKAKNFCTICVQKRQLTKGEIKNFIGVAEDGYRLPKKVPAGLEGWPVSSRGAPSRSESEGGLAAAGGPRLAVDTNRAGPSWGEEAASDSSETPSRITPAAPPPVAGMSQAVPSKPAAGSGPASSERRSLSWSAIAQCPAEYCMVDIRTKAEHKLMAIPGSISYPLSDIIDDVRQAVIYLHKKAKDRQIVLFCRNGTTSLKFAHLLDGYSVAGGVHQYLSEHQ